VPRRFAAVCALVVFALCLVLGMRAQNTFSTTVSRAMLAMAGTFVVGLVLGSVAQRMLDENLKAEEERLKNRTEVTVDDR
jgi:FtsH-binding integral membrane protein